VRDSTPLMDDARKARALRLKEFTDLPSLQVPGFIGELAPFQRVGALFMAYTRRCINGDPVGFGKTIQAIAACLLLRQKGLTRTLVMVKNDDIADQWRKEIKRFTGEVAVPVRGAKAQRRTTWRHPYDANWLIATYNVVRNDSTTLTGARFDIIIADEGDVFRNRDTKIASVLRALTRQAGAFFALTASPLQTSLMDIFGVMEVIAPEVLGPWSKFERRHIRKARIPIQRGSRRITITKITGYNDLGTVADKIDPYYIRRDESALTWHRPELMIHDVWVDLLPAQRRKYDEIISGVLRERGRIRYAALFQRFIWAWQACQTMAFFDTGEHDSSKIDAAMELLTSKFRDEKVIVFSIWHAPLDQLKQRLTEARIGWVEGTGNVPKDQRREALELFKTAPDVRVLLGTEAIERGLNLQVCRVIITMSQLYNPQRMQQIFGRAQRLGSEHQTVHAINIMARGTLEERIPQILNERRDLFGKVFKEPGRVKKSLGVQGLYKLMIDGPIATPTGDGGRIRLEDGGAS